MEFHSYDIYLQQIVSGKPTSQRNENPIKPQTQTYVGIEHCLIITFFPRNFYVSVAIIRFLFLRHSTIFIRKYKSKQERLAV